MSSNHLMQIGVFTNEATLILVNTDCDQETLV